MSRFFGFLTKDELIYICILLVSLHSGFAIRIFKGRLKAILSCLLGVILVYITCGIHIYHSLLVTAVTIALIELFSPRVSHVIVFLWCFGYLIVFRSPEYFGLMKPPAVANAVQLLLTLKLSGLAFEYHDSWVICEKIRTARPDVLLGLYLQKEYRAIQPNAFDMFTYAFCFIGLFTGPYYKFKTYQDMLDWPEEIPKPNNRHFFRRLQELPVYAFMFFFCSYFCDTKLLKSNAFYQEEGATFPRRFLYMMLVFCTFRFRMYCAWILSECLCMASHLGAYPTKAESSSGHGPQNLRALKSWHTHKGLHAASSWLDVSSIGSTNSLVDSPEKAETIHSSSSFSDAGSSQALAGSAIEYDYNTITNISIWGCEFTPTIREGMKSWNMTVQYWLAVNIHQRCPGPKFLRTFVTMLVSAYWHGLKSGYYLSFATIPFALLAENSLATVITFLDFVAPPGTLPLLRWLLKMRVFEYCSIGFLLLEYNATLRFWRSIHFCVHYAIGVVIALGLLVTLITRTRLAAS